MLTQIKKRNMKLGKIRFLLILFISFFVNSSLFSEDKISTVPLLNLEELKPSFEEIENDDLNYKNEPLEVYKRVDTKFSDADYFYEEIRKELLRKQTA